MQTFADLDQGAGFGGNRTYEACRAKSVSPYPGFPHDRTHGSGTSFPVMISDASFLRCVSARFFADLSPPRENCVILQEVFPEQIVS